MWFWMCGLKYTFLKFVVLIFALKVYKGCEAITNTEFNAQIRDYSVAEDNLNLSDVKTLQKQGLGVGRSANLAPLQNPVQFKDVPDTVISGSNHGRGLLHHEHTGYGFDYQDPHYGYEYQQHDNHHDPHDYHHYEFHDPGHHYSPGHHHGYGHHKHYNHVGFAHKSLLWPIAGIALLGAAAALVSNPVLLQLGVVSGKRRRRNVEEIENMAENSIRKWSQMTSDYKEEINNDNVKQKVTKKSLRKDNLKVVKRVLQSGKGDVLQFEKKYIGPKRYSEEDQKYIPIPLKMNNP